MLPLATVVVAVFAVAVGAMMLLLALEANILLVIFLLGMLLLQL